MYDHCQHLGQRLALLEGVLQECRSNIERVRVVDLPTTQEPIASHYREMKLKNRVIEHDSKLSSTGELQVRQLRDALQFQVSGVVKSEEAAHANFPQGMIGQQGSVSDSKGVSAADIQCRRAAKED